jgi:HlyD family secretion protein
MLWVKRILWGLLALALLLAIVRAYAPKPVPVELGPVARGPFEVTVSQPGRTRVQDRFTVSAPVGGRLLRIDLHPGDKVARGQSLARIGSLEPPLLDVRSRAQAEARVRGATAAREQAQSRKEQAGALLDFARTEVQRQGELSKSGSAPPRALELAQLDEKSRGKDLESADAALQMASWELEQARATLGRITGGPGLRDELVDLRAPIAGTVLRVLQESEGPTAPGTPLLEIGDLSHQEVLVDLLTQDAVRVAPRAKVLIERWGGQQVLQGHVRRVEPSAVTKISALGVEEQRVGVVVDLDDPPGTLGDGFRVEARITLYAAPDVLRVPAGALFRSDGGWAVFAVQGDLLRKRAVSVGNRADTEAEVLGGLAAGDRVVLHPGDKVKDGAKWEPLEGGR